jgi:nicotinate-nucleotide adenylyltransferase
MERKRPRLVVAGSAANPVSRAHRDLAELLTHSGHFDLVLWVPSGLRPDKPHLLSATHRVRMTELAFDEEWKKKQPTQFQIDLRDAWRQNTPTIYLLEELQGDYPDHEIVFATGVDVLEPREHLGGKPEVALWDEGERLMKEWTFAVLPRRGYTAPPLLQEKGDIPKHFIMLPPVPEDTSFISSTEIRKRISEGLSVDHMLHPAVLAYIHEQGLYREP